MPNGVTQQAAQNLLAQGGAAPQGAVAPAMANEAGIPPGLEGMSTGVLMSVVVRHVMQGRPGAAEALAEGIQTLQAAVQGAGGMPSAQPAPQGQGIPGPTAVQQFSAQSAPQMGRSPR